MGCFFLVVHGAGSSELVFTAEIGIRVWPGKLENGSLWVDMGNEDGDSLELILAGEEEDRKKDFWPQTSAVRL